MYFRFLLDSFVYKIFCSCGFSVHIVNSYFLFSEKRRPNNLYQELSFSEAENAQEEEVNDIAGMIFPPS